MLTMLLNFLILTEGKEYDDRCNEEDCCPFVDLVSPPPKGLLEAVLNFLLTAR